MGAVIDPRAPSRYRPAGVVEFLYFPVVGRFLSRRLQPAGSAAPCWGALSLCLFFLAPSGCSVRSSAFQIVDYRDAGDAKRYQETFDEAYYDLDDHGNVNIVLRRAGAGRRGEQDITQIIRIRSVWRSVPGRTASHRTQINSTVSYFVTGGRIGDTFEGAGAVFFTQNRGKNILTGTLDHSVLRPKRQLAPGEPLFARAELSGTFRATRDRRQVVRIVNEADRLFGPLPPQDAAK